MIINLFEFFCGTPPSCFKVGGGRLGVGSVLQHFFVSHLGTNWFLKHIKTWYGLGQGVFEYEDDKLQLFADEYHDNSNSLFF